MSTLKPLPPGSAVMRTLYLQYLDKLGRLKSRVLFDGPAMTFERYLENIGFRDPSRGKTAPQSAPSSIEALLVDFDDHPAPFPPEHYADLLHGYNIHGWIRAAHHYSFYTSDSSGIEAGFPRNAQGLAEEVFQASHVKTKADLLLIIHSGNGAENMLPGTAQRNEIWSHRWELPNHIPYLMLPHNIEPGDLQKLVSPSQPSTLESKSEPVSIGDLVKSAVLAAAGDKDMNPALLPGDTPLANKIQEAPQYVVLTSYLNGIIRHYNPAGSIKRKTVESVSTVDELIEIIEGIINNK